MWLQCGVGRIFVYAYRMLGSFGSSAAVSVVAIAMDLKGVVVNRLVTLRRKFEAAAPDERLAISEAGTASMPSMLADPASVEVVGSDGDVAQGCLGVLHTMTALLSPTNMNSAITNAAHFVASTPKHNKWAVQGYLSTVQFSPRSNGWYKTEAAWRPTCFRARYSIWRIC